MTLTHSAINAYFSLLYALQDKGAFDAKRILSLFDKQTGELDFDFKTAAEKFKLIDNNTVAVVIPYDEEARKILDKRVTIPIHSSSPDSYKCTRSIFTNTSLKPCKAKERSKHVTTLTKC